MGDETSDTFSHTRTYITLSSIYNLEGKGYLNLICTFSYFPEVLNDELK